MHNILLSFNLLKAYDIPTPKQVGNAGGTVVVTKSKALIKISVFV